MKKISITLLTVFLSVFAIISPVFASTIEDNEQVTAELSTAEIKAIYTGNASICGTSKPTSTWDLTGGTYTIGYSLASNEDLYTNYYFTGVSTLAVSIKNYRSTDLTMTLYKKGTLVDTKVSTVVFDGDYQNSYMTWNFTNLSSSSKYYCKFEAPCEFSGYVMGS